MRQSTVFLLTASAALFLAGCGHNDADSGAAKSAIQAAYNAQCDAYKRHDALGVVALCAPDYEQVDGLQTTRLPQTLQQLTTVFQTLGPIQSQASVLVCTVDGDQASVAVNRHSEMTTKATYGEPEHKMVIDESDTDTWQNVPGKGWRKLRSVTVAHKTTKDGAEVYD